MTEPSYNRDLNTRVYRYQSGRRRILLAPDSHLRLPVHDRLQLSIDSFRFQNTIFFYRHGFDAILNDSEE